MHQTNTPLHITNTPNKYTITHIAILRISDWKQSHRLSETLASLGIMRGPIKGPLKPLNTIVLWRSQGFPSIEAPWCRETPVSRTAVRPISVVFPFWNPATKDNMHTQKFFRNLTKSTWNQIVFTIFRWIWKFQIYRKTVNTIWFQVDLVRFRKDFCVCGIEGSAVLAWLPRGDN